MQQRDRTNQVFAIPLGDGTFCYGHVLAQQWPVFYMAAYNARTKGIHRDMANRVNTSSILFYGNFFDALIEKGDWPVLGLGEPPSDIAFPCYKVFSSGKSFIQSWDGTFSRVATDDEQTWVENRKNRSPMSLTMALRGYFGLCPWDNRFDGMKRDFVERSASLLDE